MRLINLGCSFSYGNQISEYEKFANQHISPGTLLSKHLNCEEYNIASPGLSLDGVLRRLYTFDFNNEDVFLVGLPPNVRLQYVSISPRNQNKIRQSDPSGKGPSEYRNHAFNQGPKIPDDWFKTLRWDIDIDIKKMDVIETTAYHSFFYILLIQNFLKDKRHWLYNSVHGHMQLDSTKSEIQKLKQQIILDNYYKPNIGMHDEILQDTKYQIARDDTHPNHKYYNKWIEEFCEWMLQSV